MNILVTGGAGYIGSHVVLDIIKAGNTPIVIDNLSTSTGATLTNIERATGAKITLYKASVENAAVLSYIFATENIEAVVHLAGLKAVGESSIYPLEYYNNNVVGALTLINQMNKSKVYRLVFSSSATVYGEPSELPIKESAPRSATNPYGRTKLMIETILEDAAASDSRWRIVSLRYFNPVGAHGSLIIGENPAGVPNNLMPLLVKVARGEMEALQIFGTDYPTPDGTCLRDYVHIEDLSRAHMKALRSLDESPLPYRAYNIGMGEPVSVKQLIHTFEMVNGLSVKSQPTQRRSGDVPELYADATLAYTDLGWKPVRTIEDACVSAWEYAKRLKRL